MSADDVVINSKVDSIRLIDVEKHDLDIGYYERSIKEALDTLGILTLDLMDSHIGFTVTVPPKHEITIGEKFVRKDGSVSKRTRKVKYCEMTPKQQYIFLLEEYLPRTATLIAGRGVGVFELTKKGDIHCHMICSDGHKYDNIDLTTIRKEISQKLIVRTMTKGCFRQGTSNYIHKVSDVPNWIRYMAKDQNGKTPIFYWKNAFE